jgi:D-alanine-D-alanine ligase
MFWGQKKLNLLVLYTSPSSDEKGTEKIYSADKNIISALKQANFNVVAKKFDENAEEFIKQKDFDCVFSLCDSFEDMKDERKVPDMLDKLGIPYNGCEGNTIELCSNKGYAKSVLLKNRIPTANFQIFNNGLEPLKEDLIFPLIVKPLRSDGSFGIDEDAVVENEEKLRKKIQKLFQEFSDGILVEQYLEGREFCVPIIGNENPLVLPILEINYNAPYFTNKPKILSYKAKWSKNSHAYRNTYSIIAKDLSRHFEERLKSIAKEAFRVMACSGYATVDLRVDKFGNIFVLEVNPNPYIAPESDTAKSALSLGWSYQNLLQKIVYYALEKHKKKKTAKTKITEAQMVKA